MPEGEGRILVLGLDCAPPRILYRDLRGELENLESLMEWRGMVRSSHPPITIPAWAVMTTGKTPGELGLYGFRHRRPGDYHGFYIADSRMVRARRVWDGLGRVVLQGIPPSYPPRPVRGVLVSDFITPGPEKQYTWPASLKGEIESLLGRPYVFDVEFRIHDKDRIVRGLWEMTRIQFKVFKHLLKTRKWDFAMTVQIGVDRVHHAFWKYYDPSHPRHPERSKYEDVIPRYYKLVDELVGDLMEAVPRGTRVIIVSDHGAKAMKGALAVNQWLEQEGFLTLKRRPERPGEDLRPGMVDWSKTKAWAWGGYYSRIFVNVKGREPEGAVDPGDVPGLLEEIKSRLRKLTGPSGEAWDTKAYTPSELYPETRGDPPDLMVYLDDLNWRAAGTIGWPSMYLEENDRGPDDAVHDWIGVAAASWDPGIPEGEVIDIKEVLYRLIDSARAG
ncbi:alkaline phosphatase family protein [Stetteria hydrogenophila]